ncbi:hypothetical protein NEUTE2DRAFT_123363 [Neurospora tetrasperma FGSC 2509]|nr:hypothetical protein NEUTE2DRAFT_123363 [Neurospora tetrasperma FGSC 2509]
MKLDDVERALAAGLLVDKDPVGEAGVPGTGKGNCAETDGGIPTYRNEENGDHCKAEEGDIGCGWSQRRGADLPEGNHGSGSRL